jgi:YhcG PDDEXK nuclease domain
LLLWWCGGEILDALRRELPVWDLANPRSFSTVNVPVEENECECFVLIDLKTAELTHQDIGQIDMYVRMFEDKVKGPGDNPTVRLVLCAEKVSAVVKYSVLKDSQQLFASRYRLYLTTEEQLREELERERDQVVKELAVAYTNGRGRDVLARRATW